MWTNVPPRAMTTYWFQSFILTTVPSAVRSAIVPVPACEADAVEQRHVACMVVEVERRWFGERHASTGRRGRLLRTPDCGCGHDSQGHTRAPSCYRPSSHQYHSSPERLLSDIVSS